MNGIVAPNLTAGVTSTHPGVPAMGVNGLSETKYAPTPVSKSVAEMVTTTSGEFVMKAPWLMTA